MDKEVKDLQSEQVRQRARVAAGAWVKGDSFKEQGSATMPEANSDHGDFTKTGGIDKSNA
jgi:hypothetical protein